MKTIKPFSILLLIAVTSCAPTTTTTSTYPDGHSVSVTIKGGIDPNGATIAQSIAVLAGRVLAEK